MDKKFQDTSISPIGGKIYSRISYSTAPSLREYYIGIAFQSILTGTICNKGEQFCIDDIINDAIGIGNQLCDKVHEDLLNQIEKKKQ